MASTTMVRELDRISASAGLEAKLIQGGSFCAVPGVGGSGGGTTAEFLPIALLLAALTGGAVWMFHRWGGRSADVAEPAPAEGERASYGHAPATNA